MEHNFIRNDPTGHGLHDDLKSLNTIYDRIKSGTPRMYNGVDFSMNASPRDIDMVMRNRNTIENMNGADFLDRYERGETDLDDPMSGYAYYPIRNLYCYVTACIPRRERECVSRHHLRVYTNKADSNNIPMTREEIIEYFMKKYEPDCVKCAWDKKDGVGWGIITNLDEYRTFMKVKPFGDAYCISFVFIKGEFAIPLMLSF